MRKVSEKKKKKKKKINEKDRRIGTAQKKILLMLFGGLALGFSYSPRGYFKVLRAMRKEWRAINQRALYAAIRRLYESHLVEEHENPDGTLTFVLSEEGKRRALTFSVENMKIKKPGAWDRKWRIVVFDIPERRRGLRDVFRARLRQLEFYELQKSVFVHPYPCTDEIDFLVELYQVRPHVRMILAEGIDSELHLRTHFTLA